MRSTKSADLIGHDKFLSWRQLDGCSVTRPFLSPAKGVACETTGSTHGCHGLFLPPALGKAYEHYVGKALHSAAYL